MYHRDRMKHPNRREFLAALALTSLGGCRGLLQGPIAPVADRPACAWPNGLAPRRIAVVGDIQRTGFLEANVLGRRQNDAERVAVLNAIAKERPDMLLILGDQVVAGEDADWRYFDSIMTPIRSAGIPVRAMLGNHDYDADDVLVALENFRCRFPHQRAEAHGLTMLGDVALLTLDSNFERLHDRDIDRQARRYLLTLERLEEDPCVRMVIVASHHPPYTNSSLDGDAELVQTEQTFARAFRTSRKTRLYLSGHVHSYERFVKDGKTFVVSGGGGGPRREVETGAGRHYTNDEFHGGRLRPFHYLMLTVGSDTIGVDVMMLPEGELSGFRVGDRFAV